jgi:diguanylate cyclase (GGDEF)-like protein
MRTLSRRAVIGLVYVCVFFAILVVGVGVAGVSGVRSTTHVGNSIVTDELGTATATARVGANMDAAYAQGEQLLLSSDRTRNRSLASTLYDTTVPAVDTGLADLVRLHATDAPTEQQDIARFAAHWKAVRRLLEPAITSQLKGPSPALADQLRVSYVLVSNDIRTQLDREDIDARAGQHEAAHTATSTTWLVALAVLVAWLAAVLIAAAGIRRIRRAVEPENDQAEFAETLQLAENEDEAHQLLKRHLERAIPANEATVLNRNNSADRLEAMTDVSTSSGLSATLEHAEPRSCLAIRSGRSHCEDAGKKPLMSCVVCGDCPGSSTCTPFTVSGEVIGSVLVTGPRHHNPTEEQRIRDSVSQAAPALANLRNLAIAELRAATDSLTGLPNKRAVTDTLKRMLAQASRTLTPMTLVLIDIDHFKDVNDRLGHPIGDQALASVGAALSSALRASDFGGRNGGEEFAVVLPDTDVHGAAATAEKIRLAIANIELPGVELAMTASLGIATYPEHSTSAEGLERLADAALYTAKRAGRNRVEIAITGPDRLSPVLPPG